MARRAAKPRALLGPKAIPGRYEELGWPVNEQANDCVSRALLGPFSGRSRQEPSTLVDEPTSK